MFTGCASSGGRRLEAVLSRKQRARPAIERIFDGEKEAKLIALACSKPPKGRARWTLRLLENKGSWNSASSRAPATQRSGARSKKHPQADRAVLGDREGQQRLRSRMEDVLAVYTRPHDPDYPLVCLDELKAATSETRVPIPMKRSVARSITYRQGRNCHAVVRQAGSVSHDATPDYPV